MSESVPPSPISSSSPAPELRFTVQTAQAAWPGNPTAGKNALCDTWIAQASAIEEAEKQSGTDQIYIAWTRIAGLFNTTMAAYAAANNPGKAPSGSVFGWRLVQPAWAALNHAQEVTAQVSKGPGVTDDELGRAKVTLAEAARSAENLGKKDEELASIPAVERNDEHETAYWVPLYMALNNAKEALETLCPRMMGIRNAASTCGLARNMDAAHCLVLRDRGQIKALAMRTLAPGLLHIDEITVEPQILQHQVKGIGGALMEYLIREAGAADSGAGADVTLLPIGYLAQKIYAGMGFTPSEPSNTNSTWVMTGQKQQEYLARHGDFAKTFKPLT